MFKRHVAELVADERLPLRHSARVQVDERRAVLEEHFHDVFTWPENFPHVFELQLFVEWPLCSKQLCLGSPAFEESSQRVPVGFFVLEARFFLPVPFDDEAGVLCLLVEAHVEQLEEGFLLAFRVYSLPEVVVAAKHFLGRLKLVFRQP